MLKNFLKTFYRNILNNRFSSFISVTGFVIGLSCAILIFIALFEEFSYESMFADRDRIFRIGGTTQMSDKSVEFAANVPALAPYVKQQIPEIESIARINNDFPESVIKTIGGQNLAIHGVCFADSTFFDVFHLKFLNGNAEALRIPGKIILTRSIAKALFGDADPIGKPVIFSDNKRLNVGAVLEDLPLNTHLRFQGLISWVTLPDKDVWDDAHSYTYMLLRKGANIETVSKKISGIVLANPEVKSVEDNLQARFELVFQPIADIHLYSHRYAELSDNANIDVLHVFFGVAIFLLLISIFNYVNITVAGSLSRAKEIGVRKVLGSLNKQIRLQFLLETAIMLFVSLGISLGLALLFVPGFSALVDLRLSLQLLGNLRFLSLMAGLVLVVVLLSAAYPAFYLSSFNPVKIFSGGGGVSRKGGHLVLSRVLVVIQLTISAAVIICTIFSVKQINFITRSDIGFDKENVIVVGTPDARRFEFFRREISKEPNVVRVAASNYSPGNPLVDEYSIEQGDGHMQTFNVRHMAFDYEFPALMGMKIVAGRNFDPSFGTDLKDGIIVNETAVKFFGWKDAIGKSISAKNYNKKGTVVGVIKNADLFSLHQIRGPLLMTLSDSAHQNGEQLFIKYTPGADLHGLLARMRQLFADAYGDIPFSYEFLDKSYDKLYRSDERYKNIVFWGGTIMIFISCLGLYGLSSFIALKKKKEVGIRKALGASGFEIVLFHTRGFLVLSLIGIVIAVPVAYYATWKWLQTFASRIDITVWVFVVSAFLMMIIVVLTTAMHAWKLSRINPGVTIRE